MKNKKNQWPRVSATPSPSPQPYDPNTLHLHMPPQYPSYYSCRLWIPLLRYIKSSSKTSKDNTNVQNSSTVLQIIVVKVQIMVVVVGWEMQELGLSFYILYFMISWFQEDKKCIQFKWCQIIGFVCLTCCHINKLSIGFYNGVGRQGRATQSDDL